jgi:acyl-CoA reductase-like NAD-dependent aldehyde dehydrogenase
MIHLEPFPFVAGKYVRQSQEAQLLVYNKFNRELIASIPQADETLAEQAIASSIQAYQELQNWSPEQRIELLSNIKNLLIERAEIYVHLIVAEAGKPVEYARQEIQRSIKTIEAGIREAGNTLGEVIPMLSAQTRGKIAFTNRFPLGPVLGITPFNFPLNLALHKIVPAIAVGTSIVLKASPQAPLTLLLFAGLIAEAGAPSGAVNVITCDIPLAEKLVKDSRFALLSFTGSARVGWHLKAIAGQKRVLLELGGNAPAIVTASADLKDAAYQLARGSFLYAGQICISTQRIYVEESVNELFTDLLLSETTHIKSGDPTNDLCINGPLIDDAAVLRIEEWITEAKHAGAQLIAGGNILSKENNLFAPSILRNVNPQNRIASEEAFGPVAVLETVRNIDHAIKLANASQYGLQCGVFTHNVDEFKTAYQGLQFAAVLMNSAPGFRVDQMPYGGVKSSGLGREGIKYAMEEYTEMRLGIM